MKQDLSEGYDLAGITQEVVGATYNATRCTLVDACKHEPKDKRLRESMVYPDLCPKRKGPENGGGSKAGGTGGEKAGGTGGAEGGNGGQGMERRRKRQTGSSKPSMYAPPPKQVSPDFVDNAEFLIGYMKLSETTREAIGHRFNKREVRFFGERNGFLFSCMYRGGDCSDEK